MWQCSCAHPQNLHLMLNKNINENAIYWNHSSLRIYWRRHTALPEACCGYNVPLSPCLTDHLQKTIHFTKLMKLFENLTFYFRRDVQILEVFLELVSSCRVSCIIGYLQTNWSMWLLSRYLNLSFIKLSFIVDFLSVSLTLTGDPCLHRFILVPPSVDSRQQEAVWSRGAGLI